MQADNAVFACSCQSQSRQLCGRCIVELGQADTSIFCVFLSFTKPPLPMQSDSRNSPLINQDKNLLVYQW
jgi:hypothetical protein